MLLRAYSNKNCDYFKAAFVNTTKDKKYGKVFKIHSFNLVIFVVLYPYCFIALHFLSPCFVMLSKIRQYQSANAVMIMAKVFARCVDITLKRIDNPL